MKVKAERSFYLDVGTLIAAGKTIEVEPEVARTLIASHKATPVIAKSERATRDGGETR